MVDSLREQLLKSGIVKADYRERPPAQSVGKTPGSRAKRPRQAARSPGEAGDIDLAKAYALRSQTQQRERQQREREAAELARERRERKARVAQLLAGKALNKVGAEHPRHFEYAGKIRRIYVDTEQLRALNQGELGVVQQGGRYLLVSGQVARQVREVDTHRLALLVEANDLAGGDDGVPDDLIW